MSAEQIRTPEVEELLQTFASLDDPDTVFAFLQDLCTVREISDMAQRLSVAKLLDAGVPYTQISVQTGASATTISRVSKSLNYGADGYRAVIGKAAAEDDAAGEVAADASAGLPASDGPHCPEGGDE